MKSRFVLLLVAGFLMTSSLVAKTMMSGSGMCKAAASQEYDVGDKPGHKFGVSQGKCTFTKPFEIAGSHSQEGMFTSHDDNTPDMTTSHEIFVDTLASGDKVFYRYDGKGILKNGALDTFTGKWWIVGGTGKASGLKGEGTCKGKGNPDGSLNFDCEGAYWPK